MLEKIEILSDRVLMWHKTFAVSRLLLSIAQLSVFAFTQTHNLFPPLILNNGEHKCEALGRAFSAYCLGDMFNEKTGTIIIVCILLWFGSGLLPQISGFAFVWSTFSFAQTIHLPDGGDYVAQVISVFLAVLGLPHTRIWYWQKPDPRTIKAPLIYVHKLLRLMTVPAYILLKLQFSWIYLNAAIAKTAVEQWQDGTAFYYVVRQEFFGVSGAIGDFIIEVSKIPIVTLGITWGVIIIEIAIALSLFLPRRLGIISLIISTTLHLSIFLFIGLFSFALIMIGGMIGANANSVYAWLGRNSQHTTPQSDVASK
ncbi:hypothetical protein [Corynebacterium pseudodiphtheriticum]|uniref:hypothetical protein n=1 Tax=Corynebacterium pseudodiphtheriticum TaxID=37637 RepID=UPI0025434811|nr:hypothetical protein [Corynebacterium pseudodiphtheriticum]MDK4240210.1 hypothetical protein [Corynebacterium pseudodiphtheriticum]